MDATDGPLTRSRFEPGIGKRSNCSRNRPACSWTASTGCWRIALHEASLRGHLEVASYLLDQGADASARGKRWGASAFGWADEGDKKDVLELLFKRAQPDVFDAVELNLSHHVHRLLDDDSSLVHAPDGQGAPLRIAAAAGHIELVRLLLQRGADDRPRNRQGQSALDLARSKGHNEIVRWLEKAISRRGAETQRSGKRKKLS